MSVTKVYGPVLIALRVGGVGDIKFPEKNKHKHLNGHLSTGSCGT